MNQTHLPNPDPCRIGFHYFPDSRHYRQSDLETWLPRLSEMGAAWVTLLAPAERAIPEDFIRGLVAANIQPVLHFCLSPAQPAPLDTLDLLLSAYTRWGVRQVAFYDRPNTRQSWPAPIWAQNYLAERFLDAFVPLALASQERGLTVIYPPLEPGGDYWDLAFLRATLRGLQRRRCNEALDSLAIGAYAWINDRPLDWGAGGPGRWPEARPYQTPEAQQDQIGFRIFDWYLEICQEELGRKPPVYLLRAGQRLPVGQHADLVEEQMLAARISHARLNLNAARWIDGDPGSELAASAVPVEVLACNFWLLAAEPGQTSSGESWYQPCGEQLPVVEAFRQWTAYRRLAKDAASSPRLAECDRSEPAVTRDPGGLRLHSDRLPDAPAKSVGDEEPGADGDAIDDAGCDASEVAGETGPENVETPEWTAASPDGTARNAHPLGHYVLLPLYAWGAANWDLALVESLLQESRPAIGFSLAEARLAKRVTVVGAEGAVSAEALAMLRQSGCQVERLLEDGTLIAT